jgi:hypothetical protein
MVWAKHARCLHCKAQLPLIRKLAHAEFCSEAHMRAFQQENAKLAINRLMESRRTFAPEPAADSDQESPPLPAPLRPTRPAPANSERPGPARAEFILVSDLVPWPAGKADIIAAEPIAYDLGGKLNFPCGPAGLALPRVPRIAGRVKIRVPAGNIVLRALPGAVAINLAAVALCLPTAPPATLAKPDLPPVAGLRTLKGPDALDHHPKLAIEPAPARELQAWLPLDGHQHRGLTVPDPPMAGPRPLALPVQPAGKHSFNPRDPVAIRPSVERDFPVHRPTLPASAGRLRQGRLPLDENLHDNGATVAEPPMTGLRPLALPAQAAGKQSFSPREPIAIAPSAGTGSRVHLPAPEPAFHRGGELGRTGLLPLQRRLPEPVNASAARSRAQACAAFNRAAVPPALDFERSGLAARLGGPVALPLFPATGPFPAIAAQAAAPASAVMDPARPTAAFKVPSAGVSLGGQVAIPPAQARPMPHTPGSARRAIRAAEAFQPKPAMPWVRRSAQPIQAGDLLAAKAQTRRSRGWPAFRLPQVPRRLLLGLAAIPGAALIAMLAASGPQAPGSPKTSMPAFLNSRVDALRSAIRTRAGVEFLDDFRSGLDNWESKSDLTRTWSFDSTGFVRPGPVAIFRPSLGMSEYDFEFLGQIDQRALGWVYRAADLQNYYVGKIVLLQRGPLPAVGLERYTVRNGKESSHTTVVLPLNARRDTIYRVRLEARGPDFSLYLQNQIMQAWTDRSLPAGGIGLLSSRGEQSRIRWIQVSHQNDALGRLCAYFAPTMAVATYNLESTIGAEAK